MNHLEEIRGRLSIEELVGSYVQLKKAGRNFKGLCPFHGEKTPSFMVSPEKQIAYCFGCHQGGDIFKFVELVENVDFGEAVKILAQKTGVKLPDTAPKEHSKRLKTVEINQATADYFVSQLGVHKDYFTGRGLTEATIQQFKLGYSPDSFNALKEHLKSQGFSEKDMLDAGVINQKSVADTSTYDRFRNRLMFPIFDHQSNVVAFGGRIIGEGEPKYLNSPDTPAYNKSMVLYGLHEAKEAIKSEGIAIFVEGYMDVIASHQAGVKNVIATSGTALAPQQLKLIKRYTKKVALAFDQDGAGMEATMRAIELAQEAEIAVHIIKVPNGKDPDECIKEDPALWKKATETPLTAMDFYFDYAKSKADPNTLEGKKEILSLMLPLIKLVPSDVERGIHLNRLAVEIKTDVKHLWNDLNNLKATPNIIQKPVEPGVATPVQYSREEYLLGLICKFPETYPYVHKNLIENIPFNPLVERFYKSLKSVYTPEGLLEVGVFLSALNPEDRQKVDVLSLLIDEAYPDFSEEAAQKEIISLVKTINKENLKKIQKEIELSIRGTQDTAEKTRLLNKYNEILKLTQKAF